MRPWRSKRGRIALALVPEALLAVGLVILQHLRSPAVALAFKERDWILITDFENLTGEPVFDGSWRGRENCLSDQDIVVAARAAASSPHP